MKVDLSCATELGLVCIALCPSGVWYTNQTGGTSCHHPEAEGVLIPIRHSLDGSRDCLTNRQNADDDGETERKLIAKWLEEHDIDWMFEPRTDEQHQLEEAWVPVRIKHNARPPAWWYKPLADFEGYDAVLTYDNSD